MQLPLPDYRAGILTCTTCHTRWHTYSPDPTWRTHLRTCTGQPTTTPLPSEPVAPLHAQNVPAHRPPEGRADLNHQR